MNDSPDTAGVNSVRFVFAFFAILVIGLFGIVFSFPADGARLLGVFLLVIGALNVALAGPNARSLMRQSMKLPSFGRRLWQDLGEARLATAYRWLGILFALFGSMTLVKACLIVPVTRAPHP